MGQRLYHFGTMIVFHNYCYGEKQTPPTADSVGSRGNKVGLTPAVLLRSITTPVGIAPMTIANSLGGIGIPYSLHQKFLI